VTEPPPYPRPYYEYETEGRAALRSALLAGSTALTNLRRKWAPRTGVGDEADVRAVPQEE
jgi:hypothetical protein